jgi:hypothetical protein
LIFCARDLIRRSYRPLDLSDFCRRTGESIARLRAKAYATRLYDSETLSQPFAKFLHGLDDGSRFSSSRTRVELQEDYSGGRPAAGIDQLAKIRVFGN